MPRSLGDRTQIYNRLHGIICEVLQVKPDSVVETTTFEQLEADSLDITELAMTVEEVFDIDIPEKDQSRFVSVAAAVEYLVERGQN